MATITLKEGDFGSAEAVTVGEAALYLPDRARPGLNELVPLTAIAEIEDLSDDRSGQLKQAARLGLRGLLTTGNPLGLAASVFAVTKVKDVEFSVRLKDGRHFVATADAGTLADLRAACRTALIPSGEDAEAAARADAIIAKYLDPGALPLEPVPQPQAAVATAQPPEPVPEPQVAVATAQPQASDSRPSEAADARAAGAVPARLVFGRRGVR